MLVGIALQDFVAEFIVGVVGVLAKRVDDVGETTIHVVFPSLCASPGHRLRPLVTA